jgi:hypothetical protein
MLAKISGKVPEPAGLDLRQTAEQAGVFNSMNAPAFCCPTWLQDKARSLRRRKRAAYIVAD